MAVMPMPLVEVDADEFAQLNAEYKAALLKLGEVTAERDNAMNELFRLKLRLADIQAAWAAMSENSIQLHLEPPKP